MTGARCCTAEIYRKSTITKIKRTNLNLTPDLPLNTGSPRRPVSSNFLVGQTNKLGVIPRCFFSLTPQGSYVCKFAWHHLQNTSGIWPFDSLPSGPGRAEALASYLTAAADSLLFILFLCPFMFTLKTLIKYESGSNTNKTCKTLLFISPNLQVF